MVLVEPVVLLVLLELLMSFDVDGVLFVEDEDESVLVVPRAPMLDVPVELLGVFAVLELEVELLGVEVVDDELPIVLALFLLASVLPCVVEALVPPAPPALAPPVCATATPPTARAAAAARVVSAFLVVVMSCSLNWQTPEGAELMASRRIADWKQD